jgi:hypothetical protein
MLGKIKLQTAALFISLTAILPASAEMQSAQRAQRIELVNLYIGELEKLQNLQQTSAKEFAEDETATARLMTGIRVGTRTIYAMNEIDSRLDLLKLPESYQKLISLLRSLNEQRIECVKELVSSAKIMLSAQPGDNVSALVARAPELTAEMEKLNTNIFKVSPYVSLSLMDDTRLNKEGNFDHLILTEKQRVDMVALLKKIFGKALDEEHQNNFVSAAAILKEQLTRGVPTADMP